jgi:hypothetical protein
MLLPLRFNLAHGGLQACFASEPRPSNFLLMEEEFPVMPVCDTPLQMFFNALLRHGTATQQWKHLATALYITNQHLETPLEFLAAQEWAEGKVGLEPKVITKVDLASAASASVAGLDVAYRVRYCQLNRKLRKIVKNKYRYQKRYEWLPPHMRPAFAVSLLKQYVKTRTELTFPERIAGALAEQLLFAPLTPLTLLAHQTQTVAVSTLAQTARGK